MVDTRFFGDVTVANFSIGFVSGDGSSIENGTVEILQDKLDDLINIAIGQGQSAPYFLIGQACEWLL